MIDYKEIQREYALSYSDSSRIYFIEKYLSTFNADAGKRTPFMLFPRQKAFLHSIAEHGRSIAIKHRQAGITTVSSAYIAAQIALADPAKPETVLCIGNKLDLANQLVTKIREFLMQVPRWYWGDEYYSPDPKSDKNKKDIFLKNSKSELQLFNGCAVFARSSGENAARGISAVSILVFDEAAFIENGPAVYSSAVAATSSYGDRAKIIMVSTPNGKDELYYKTYRQALSYENNYNAVEFKWFQDLRYNKNLKWRKKDEKTGEDKWIVEETLDKTGSIKYDEEKWRKLEREGWIPTSPWYESMCASFNNDSMKIAQELDVSFLGSSDNVVAPEFIEQQNTLNVMDPLEDFKDPMTEDTWFWKKPIDGHRYICACLPTGEKVLTQRGLINVEDVKADDLLVTKEGEYTKIKHRKYREVVDEEIVEIKLHNFVDSIKFTWNHPIWVSNNTYKRQIGSGHNRARKLFHTFSFQNANTIIPSSWIEIPNFYKIHTLSENEIEKKWDDYLYKFNNQTKVIKCPLLNEEFWWFCGMWIAEGYTHKNVICTSHHIKENSYYNRIAKICETLFDRHARFTPRIQSNNLRVEFSSTQIADFLQDTFGKYAYGKFISEWVKFLPERYKLKLIEGYFDGDGCYMKSGIVAATVSHSLVNDIQDVLLSIGIVSNALKKYDNHDEMWGDKIVHKLTKYELYVNLTYKNKLFSLLKRDKEITSISRNIRNQNVYFSDDLTKLFIKVKEVTNWKYSGLVYNFETKSDSHSFCARHIATHNCDPSRGTSADRTAIEIIDMDGRDNEGLPIVEQVAEYVGKKLGDDIGSMVVQYAKLYNNAYVVVDATGGQGDAAILTMINLGYTNLYYEDSNQKEYTVQNSTKNYDSYDNRLPGFHFQGNRYPVLASFAGMVRNNEFKIRSARVINELDTWIFKEGTGRIDHMSGSHDDTLTSLAMGLFVMKYSLNRIEKAVNKDKAILNAYIRTKSFDSGQSRIRNDVPITPKAGLPYVSKNKSNFSNIHGNYMWLFAGYK